jgi:hypothetical protein
MRAAKIFFGDDFAGRLVEDEEGYSLATIMII